MKSKAGKFNRKISIDNFCRLLHCSHDTLPCGLKEKLASINTNYRLASASDRQEYIQEVLQQINSPLIRRSRQENLRAWERGWGENLEAFQRNFSEKSLKPKYFRPSRFFRYNKTVIIPENKHIEYGLFTVVRHYLFQRFFTAYDSIYELGSGSCQNIYSLARLFPQKKIFALDWTISSKQISGQISKKMNRNVEGLIFDLTNPSERLHIADNSIVFSIHSFEQLGLGYKKLLRFLLKRRPSLILHYEPIIELFDTSNIYDCLASIYCKTRNYLRGYLTQLHKLSDAGKIEIIEETRPCIGGIYHDSSVIAWRPI